MAGDTSFVFVQVLNVDVGELHSRRLLQHQPPSSFFLSFSPGLVRGILSLSSVAGWAPCGAGGRTLEWAYDCPAFSGIGYSDVRTFRFDVIVLFKGGPLAVSS